jgi:hypothetical protein
VVAPVSWESLAGSSRLAVSTLGSIISVFWWELKVAQNSLRERGCSTGNEEKRFEPVEKRRMEDAVRRES